MSELTPESESNGEDVVEQVDVDQFSDEPTDNPLAGSIPVSMSVPGELTIEMVEASRLSDFELWSFIAALMSNFAVGFIVAAVQEDDPKVNGLLGLVGALFSLLLAASLGILIVRRNKLKRKARKVPFEIKRAQPRAQG